MGVETGFDPSVHGFSFRNSFPGGAVVAELTRQGRVTDLTGLQVPRSVSALTDLASGADFWGAFGLCGGMSWTALDRYRRGLPVGGIRSVPGRDDDLFRELVSRQADSMRGRTLLERCIVWQFLPDRVPWWMIWAKGVGRLSAKLEWPKLRTALGSGTPTGLVLMRARGAATPSGNHQVVAVGYRDSGSGTVSIDIYDPNHPGKRPSIPMDTESETVGPRQSTGEPVRGFFTWSP